MHWTPPARVHGIALRDHLSEDAWRVAIAEIAEKHALGARELEPYARVETVVWRVGEFVIKLTTPEYAFQIEAEVRGLQGTHGKLSVATPSLHAQGDLAGWPYVIMGRIQGVPLGEIWPQLDRPFPRLSRSSHGGSIR